MLVDLVNGYFEELVKKPKTFLDAAIALYQKIAEVYEPRISELKGIRALVEALKELREEYAEKLRRLAEERPRRTTKNSETTDSAVCGTTRGSQTSRPLGRLRRCGTTPRSWGLS
jgi:uncharacterized coiled-coil DUF342 family protein